MKMPKTNKGFTLIELLVVITIIGILATLAAFGTERSFQTSRDTARRSDLKQYQSTLEGFANNNDGLYPSRNAEDGQPAATILCGDLGIASGDCPDDPLYERDNSWTRYTYKSDGTGSGNADATEYILWAELESSDDGYFVCSNGKSGNSSFATYDPGLSGVVNCPL